VIKQIEVCRQKKKQWRSDETHATVPKKTTSKTSSEHACAEGKSKRVASKSNSSAMMKLTPLLVHKDATGQNAEEKALQLDTDCCTHHCDSDSYRMNRKYVASQNAEEKTTAT
jgi:hypothetical protein